MSRQQAKNLKIILEWEQNINELMKRPILQFADVNTQVYLQFVDINTHVYREIFLRIPPEIISKAANECKRGLRSVPQFADLVPDQFNLILAAYGFIQKNESWRNYHSGFYRAIRKIVGKKLGKCKYIYLMTLIYFLNRERKKLVIPGISPEIDELLKKELSPYGRIYVDNTEMPTTAYELFGNAEKHDFRPFVRKGEKIIREIILPLIKERSKSEGCYLEKYAEKDKRGRNDKVTFFLKQDPESPTKIKNSTFAFRLYMISETEPFAIEICTGEKDGYYSDVKYSDVYKELLKESPAPYVRDTILRRNF